MHWLMNLQQCMAFSKRSLAAVSTCIQEILFFVLECRDLHQTMSEKDVHDELPG
jgi:hypothetical protein